MPTKKTIALVGGTGNLGRLIVDALLAKPNVHSGGSWQYLLY
jgi:uncharacterized protein YbjT (DUF2867 family)